MAPGLLPGDWLLVEPASVSSSPPSAGQLVVVPDPRQSVRLLVKRVGAMRGDGRLWLVGDSANDSTDSRAFGAVDVATVVGRPWFRYWPPVRMSRVG
jgi:nickel-type superoxide dismutase maturation protease